MLQRSSLCVRVMSSLKISNITNSMQYSALWMCLEWVCWIILLNKCAPRANLRIWFSTGGGNITQQIAVEVSLLYCVLDSVYILAIIHTEPWFVTFPSWINMYTVGQVRTVLQIELEFYAKFNHNQLALCSDKLTIRLWSAWFCMIFSPHLT